MKTNFEGRKYIITLDAEMCAEQVIVDGAKEYKGDPVIDISTQIKGTMDAFVNRINAMSIDSGDGATFQILRKEQLELDTLKYFLRKIDGAGNVEKDMDGKTFIYNFYIFPFSGVSDDVEVDDNPFGLPLPRLYAPNPDYEMTADEEELFDMYYQLGDKERAKNEGGMGNYDFIKQCDDRCWLLENGYGYTI